MGPIATRLVGRAEHKFLLRFGNRKRLAESEAKVVGVEKEREDWMRDSGGKAKEIAALKEEVENLKELDKIKDVTSQLR